VDFSTDEGTSDVDGISGVLGSLNKYDVQIEEEDTISRQILHTNFDV